MRRLCLFAFLSSLALAVLSACGGGGGCVIDSDCPDLTQVCVARQCVPAGTVPDAGRRDAGPQADASTPRDGGQTADAGSTDAATADGAVDGSTDGGGPACTDITGAWSVSAVLSAPGTCGAAAAGYGMTVSVATSACDVTVASNDLSLPALDGTITVAADNNLTGSLNPGGAGVMACTGSISGTSITVL